MEERKKEILSTFKGTSKDLKCHGGFQYELGKTVTDDGAIRCGGKGFHSCEAPLDVLRYFPLRDGNRYFTAEAAGTVSRDRGGDSKIATSELTLRAEIGLPGLIKAHFEYTRKKAEQGGANGDGVNLAGGEGSNLAGGYKSNLAGGEGSNLAGGNWSNLAGGYKSNLAGGEGSNLAGGEGSLLVGRTGSRLKGGFGSILVFSEWGWKIGTDGERRWAPVVVKPVVVDGETIQPDVWYTLNGETVEEVKQDE